MKLLFSLLLLASLSSLGQSSSRGEFTDTVPSVMLISDTSVANSGIRAIRGFAVRKHYWPYHPDYSVIGEQMEIDIISYLYVDKYPLKYFVWLSKEIKTPNK